MQQKKIIDLQISSTCFGQFFAHPQERKIVIYSVWYNVWSLCRRTPGLRPTTIVGYYATCCKSKSCAPKDGQRIFRYMLS